MVLLCEIFVVKSSASKKTDVSWFSRHFPIISRGHVLRNPSASSGVQGRIILQNPHLQKVDRDFGGMPCWLVVRFNHNGWWVVQLPTVKMLGNDQY